MAATELNSTPRLLQWARVAITTYTGLWTITLTAAAATRLAGPALARPARRLLGLTLTAGQNPPASVGHALQIGAHNLPVAAWPLLLGLTAPPRTQTGRAATDALVTASALANTLPLGAALGAYGSALIGYVPQLPLEWAALAVGYGSWRMQRHTPLRGHERLLALASIAITLAAAAAIESWCVPHR